ncbi:hypothetical protein fugu_019220 [Takifugu bimaculatus]|uniref:Secreted protein n=1 Tax=Takifugu bimaculatus TaxID=433685 RepID=A0A4Z2BKJ9_9TELE|nr:hypothetical protein fugu_019220 [Takifugu bimaculatus]
MHTCTAAVLVVFVHFQLPPSLSAPLRALMLRGGGGTEAPQSPSELQEILPSTGGDRKTPSRAFAGATQRPAASLGHPPPPKKKKAAQVKRSHVGVTVHPFVLQICVCLLQLFPDLWRKEPRGHFQLSFRRGKSGGKISANVLF